MIAATAWVFRVQRVVSISGAISARSQARRSVLEPITFVHSNVGLCWAEGISCRRARRGLGFRSGSMSAAC